ncbi:MAG TPA: orotidine-5'-phosphate decarboxylase [Planctomycetaceae bacterium]|nr:orotidine-5'-phosphate decarboxylase [Planctomycetaceae bacterium]
MNFGSKLEMAVRQKHSAVCVGLDPRWANLPSAFTDGVDKLDLVTIADRTTKYCCEVIDATVEFSPIVKPQAAFFELLGPPGMQALGSVIAHARKAGMLVLLDGKRGDIGSTAEGYAAAYLGETSPWGCDALTINAFLGNDTLEPFVKRAGDTGTGIFVLVKTSNPGSGFIQDLKADSLTISEQVAEVVQQHCEKRDGKFGDCGAVVGATYPEQLAEMRKRMPNAWLLIPGYGAQGGSADDVAHGFDSDNLGAIVNSSRGIIFAYEKEEFAGMNWQDAVASAAQTMANALPKFHG